mmetsp:Transcript_10617/g.19815  ORF Transcript_10617/g.19815 Transcript_10617/m.19815 type:complete len:151 (+) Transcript_10617:429-881(+)
MGKQWRGLLLSLQVAIGNMLPLQFKRSEMILLLPSGIMTNSSLQYASKSCVIVKPNEYWSNVDGIKGYVTNFEKLVMPNNLRANGVPLSIWEKVFVESVNLLQENRFYTWYKVEGLDYIHPRNLLHFTTLVSNFNAKANFLLNPYGIQVS